MSIFNFRVFTRPGFYVSLVAIAALLVGAFSYTNGFTDNLLEYNNSNVLQYAFITIAVYLVVALFGPIANLAPIALFGGVLITLLAYVKNIYMYFTGIFYNGVSAEAFALIDPIVMTSTICFVVAFLVSNVAFYFGHRGGY